MGTAHPKNMATSRSALTCTIDMPRRAGRDHRYASWQSAHDFCIEFRALGADGIDPA
jgi:hypothetical protein